MATSGHACISFILKVSFKFQLVFSCLQIVFIDPIYTGWREVISFFLYCQTEHSFSSANSSHHQQYDIQVKYHSTVNIELFKTRAVRSHKWTLRLSAQPAQIYSFFLFYLFFFHFSFKLFITLMGKWKVQFFACFNCQLTRQEITLGHLTLSKQILKLNRLFKPYFVKKMNHGAKKVLFLLLTRWDRPRKWPLKPSCIAAWLVPDMFPQTLAISLPLQRQWLVIKWLLLCSLIEVIECS